MFNAQYKIDNVRFQTKDFHSFCIIILKTSALLFTTIYICQSIIKNFQLFFMFG